MQIEVVTIGSELLLGFTIDTNAAHLARELSAIGVEIVRRTTVGDDADAVADAVRQALERSEGVITTGGLGPTADDLTKPAIARLFGRAMYRDEETVASLEAFWRARGRIGTLPAANLQQAMIPVGATILRNRHGTAPGIWLEDERGRWVAMLPGVPREMRGMLAEELMPHLAARTTDGRVVRSRTIRTTGIAESQLPDKLGALSGGTPPLRLAYVPGLEGVDLRLTVGGLPGADADRLLAAEGAAIRERVGVYVYGEEGDDLAAIVLTMARDRGQSIAAAESCTGGMLGMRLTAIPGSSDVFLGGIVAYDNRIKEAQLGVQAATLAAHGAVSEPVAAEMAAGVRDRLGADIGVGITGVAGPAGGTADKPVGMVCLAVATPERPIARTVRFAGDRHEIRARAAQAALDMIRRTLLASP